MFLYIKYTKIGTRTINFGSIINFVAVEKQHCHQKTVSKILSNYIGELYEN